MITIRKLIKKIIVGVLIIYAAACVLIYFYPRPFFYNPTNQESVLENAHANGYKAEEIKYQSADGTPLFAWYTKPEAKHKVIIFMHGNSYNVEKFYHKMIPLMRAGYGTFMPEYRGYGNVPGQIRQHNLEADALAAVKELHKMGYKNEDIIIYGMSLGSHMATYSAYQLQKDGPFAALILEVPFDSLLNVTKLVVPVPLPLEYIVRDKYDNTQMITAIKSPILILGGSKDPTVPVELAKNLYKLAPQPKKMIIYQGGAHSDLYNFENYKDILNWLKKI